MANRTEYKDLLLPIAVVAVLGMMLFPLPALALDALLICNISFSLALLISSVYLSQPQGFTSLPAILLLTTLFRLGLNVSTTRQILSGEGVPDVILTFGSFVVRGNLVVGVVIFAIITLVQFLVIAKGAERVAEVAARFTLDAMPGRQMSIDADIRSGLIGPSEARERRRELQTESKLFGALDGAMKFIKGDAIAGLLITIINISAGLIVGVSQQGLGLVAAVEKFTLYTIGDGLVSQIPALLVAVAAGIAVTRVDDPRSRFVGRDMLAQLSREPQGLATTGVVLFALALVPGLPFFSFAGMSVAFLVTAKRVRNRLTKQEQLSQETEFKPKVLSGLVLRLSLASTLRLQQEALLPQQIPLLRAAAFERWGIIVPDVQFDIDRRRSGMSAVLYHNGVGLVQFQRQQSEITEKSSLSESVLELFEQFLDKHLQELVDDTQTRTLLEVHQVGCEDLINSVVPEMISVTSLTTLLRQLIAERVSIQSLNVILQAIAETRLSDDESGLLREAQPLPRKVLSSALGRSRTTNDSGRADTVELLAAVRIALNRTIALDVADANACISGWLLDSELDQLIAKSALGGVVLDPRATQEIIAAVRGAKIADNGGRATVVVTSKYARTYLANLLPSELRKVRVLAVDELPNEVRFSVLGELTTAKITQTEEAVVQPRLIAKIPGQKITVLGQAAAA